jgi:hypothetical protein
LQKLAGGKHCPGFLVVEEFGSVFEYLQLSAGTVSNFNFNAFFGSGFAQAPGRASQIESKEAASYFNHIQFLQTAFAARIVFK